MKILPYMLIIAAAFLFMKPLKDKWDESKTANSSEVYVSCGNTHSECLKTATDLSRNQRYKEAIQIADKLCREGYDHGCQVLAINYGFDQQHEKAYAIRYRYCVEKNNPIHCFGAGLTLVQLNRSADAQYFFKKACGANIQKGCEFLSGKNTPAENSQKITFEEWVSAFNQLSVTLDKKIDEFANGNSSNEAWGKLGEACQQEFVHIKKVLIEQTVVESSSALQEAKLKYLEAADAYLPACQAIIEMPKNPAGAVVSIAKAGVQVGIKHSAAKRAFEKARAPASSFVDSIANGSNPLSAGFPPTMILQSAQGEIDRIAQFMRRFQSVGIPPNEMISFSQECIKELKGMPELIKEADRSKGSPESVNKTLSEAEALASAGISFCEAIRDSASDPVKHRRLKALDSDKVFIK